MGIGKQSKTLNKSQIEMMRTFLRSKRNGLRNESNYLEKTSLTDYLIFATGTSNRHIGSISEAINQKLKKLNMPLPSVEGKNDSGWIVIDGGDVIVHLFKDEIRKFYNLENMWSAEIQ